MLLRTIKVAPVRRQIALAVCWSLVGVLISCLLQSAIVAQEAAEVESNQQVVDQAADKTEDNPAKSDSGEAGHTDAGHSDAGHSESHDSHGGHGHEFDPTHANMSDDAEDPSEWRSEKAIATLIVFGCLLAGLTAVAWKPIREGLEKREKTIANNIANAENASQQAMAKLREYEAKLTSASSEAQQILADARKDAEAAGQRLIAAAQEEASRQRDRAVADIESAKAVALNELAEKSTDVAMTLASRIVGREVKAGDHQNMIQEMLSKLPSQN